MDKGFPDKFQGIGQTAAPVLPVMTPGPHDKRMRNMTLCHQNMHGGIADGNMVVVAAVEIVFYLFEF